jgi:hypothetical protein
MQRYPLLEQGVSKAASRFSPVAMTLFTSFPHTENNIQTNG